MILPDTTRVVSRIGVKKYPDMSALRVLPIQKPVRLFFATARAQTSRIIAVVSSTIFIARSNILPGNGMLRLDVSFRLPAFDDLHVNRLKAPTWSRDCNMFTRDDFSF